MFLRKSEACDSPEVETHHLPDVAEATRVPPQCPDPKGNWVNFIHPWDLTSLDLSDGLTESS